VRPAAAAWALASALSVGAGMVVVIVLQPHWQARELDWMLGGAAALVACVLATQACFRLANRLSPPAERDIQSRIQQMHDDLDEGRRSLEAMAEQLEAQRELMDPATAKSLDDLRQSLHQRAIDAGERERRQRRERRPKVLVAWIVGIVVAVVLLEMRR
jgi:uncharacterized protein YhaN